MKDQELKIWIMALAVMVSISIIIIETRLLHPNNCLDCRVVDVMHLAMKICAGSGQVVGDYNVTDNKIKYINCVNKTKRLR